MREQEPNPSKTLELQQRAMSHTGELYLATNDGVTVGRGKMPPELIDQGKRNVHEARRALEQATQNADQQHNEAS